MARRKIGSYLGDFAARRAGVGIGVLPVPIRVVEVREEDPEEHGNEEHVYDDGNEGLRARDRAVVRVIARATLDALTSAVAPGAVGGVGRLLVQVVDIGSAVRV